MKKSDVRCGDRVQVMAKTGTIPDSQVGMIGTVFFVDPVAAISLSIGVRLDGNVPIRISPNQIRKACDVL